MRRGLLIPLILLTLIGLPMTGDAQLNDDWQELKGIIDIHAHVGPATDLSLPRTFDAIEITQLAARHGMRAINMKQHYLETASWAYLVSRVVPGIKVFGGIALNRSVGGLNVNAVEQVATFKGGSLAEFRRKVDNPTGQRRSWRLQSSGASVRRRRSHRSRTQDAVLVAVALTVPWRKATARASSSGGTSAPCRVPRVAVDCTAECRWDGPYGFADLDND